MDTQRAQGQSLRPRFSSNNLVGEKKPPYYAPLVKGFSRDNNPCGASAVCCRV